MFESKNYPDRYMGIKGTEAVLTSEDGNLRHFRVVKGLCGVAGTVSFESIMKRGYFFRPINSRIHLSLLRSNSNYSFRKQICFFARYNKYFDVRKLNFS